MAGERWLCVAVVAVVAVLAVVVLGGGVARADIINGDFSDVPKWADGLDWEVLDGFPVGQVVVEVAYGELHVKTSNTWDWVAGHWAGELWEAGYWMWRETEESAVAIIQNVQAEDDNGVYPGLYAPPGTTAIEFDARITISDNPACNIGPKSAGVMFYVIYGDHGGSTGLEPLGDTDQKLRVEMPDLIPDSDDGIQLSLIVFSGLDVKPEHSEGVNSFTITVDAYFDNFHFVPEPMSAALLLVGAAGLMLRRGRRRA